MIKPSKQDTKYRKTGNIQSINYERYALDLEKYIEWIKNGEADDEGKANECEDCDRAGRCSDSFPPR